MEGRPGVGCLEGEESSSGSPGNDILFDDLLQEDFADRQVSERHWVPVVQDMVCEGAGKRNLRVPANIGSTFGSL